MSQNLSEYERLRLRNIADNKRILSEIGLTDPLLEQLRLNKAVKPKVKKVALKRKAEDDGEGRPRKVLLTEDLDSMGSLIGDRRKSARIQGKAAASEEEVKEEVARWEEDEENRPVRVPKNRPNHYGIVEGVPVGTTWLTRMECCRDGIHRPTVAGIHGGPEGAYSIALSGGYNDNIDLGEGFTYTGEGGRDLKGTANNPKNLRTAPQSKDQLLSRGNLALCRSQETGQPVRVIRGYKLTSPFAPDEGYRYDGLYRVEKCWYCTGVSGFKVWKFALKRLSDQPSPPWTYGESEEEPLGNKETMSEAGSYDSGCHVDDTDSITSSQKSYQSTDSTKTHNDTDDKGNTVSSQESDQGMEDTKTRDEEDKENTESKVSDQGNEDIKTQNDKDGTENTATSQESDEGMNDDTGHCKKDDKENNTSSTECDQAIDDTKTQSQEDDVESTKISKKSDQDVANVETESTSISQQPQIDVEVKTESPIADVEMEGEKDVESFPVKENEKNDTTESHVDGKDTQKSTESLDKNDTEEKPGRDGDEQGEKKDKIQ